MRYGHFEKSGVDVSVTSANVIAELHAWGWHLEHCDSVARSPAGRVTNVGPAPDSALLELPRAWPSGDWQLNWDRGLLTLAGVRAEGSQGQRQWQTWRIWMSCLKIRALFTLWHWSGWVNTLVSLFVKIIHWKYSGSYVNKLRGDKLGGLDYL